MNTPLLAVLSFGSSLPGSEQGIRRKPSLDDKLDRVFQVVEHVDAKCVHLLDAAAERRRASSHLRY
jgi:hypothetical protein